MLGGCPEGPVDSAVWLGLTGLGGGWWELCFSDLGDLRSGSGSATKGFDFGSVTPLASVSRLGKGYNKLYPSYLPGFCETQR